MWGTCGWCLIRPYLQAVIRLLGVHLDDLVLILILVSVLQQRAERAGSGGREFGHLGDRKMKLVARLNLDLHKAFVPQLNVR